MNPKIIMMPFNGSDHELAALETAFLLAKKWKAHVSVWHALPNPEEIITYSSFIMGTPYLPDESSYAELLKLNEKSRKETQQKFIKTAKKAGIICDDYPTGKEASASFRTAWSCSRASFSKTWASFNVVGIVNNSSAYFSCQERMVSQLFICGLLN